MWILLSITIFFIAITNVNGKIALGYCNPTARSPCPRGQMCLDLSSSRRSSYGECILESDYCAQGPWGKRCGPGKKCLKVDSKGTTVCMDDSMFCKVDNDCGRGHICMKTDDKRNEGICVLDYICQNIMGAPDSVDCPANYRCCLIDAIEGKCMKGDYKDVIPLC